MINASQLRSGAVVRLDQELYKVVESVQHAGGGRAGSMVHAKLRNLSTGHFQERRWAPDEKVDDLPLTRVKMQYLYAEGDAFTFMNAETFDQIPIGRHAIGPGADFLKESDELEVEFSGEQPVAVLYPETVKLHVTTTGAGLRGKTDSTLKEATLETGVTVLVPQFIETGDLIEVAVEGKKYVSRINEKSAKK